MPAILTVWEQQDVLEWIVTAMGFSDSLQSWRGKSE